MQMSRYLKELDPLHLRFPLILNSITTYRNGIYKELEKKQRQFWSVNPTVATFEISVESFDEWRPKKKRGVDTF